MAKKTNRRPTKGRAPRTRQAPARTNGASPGASPVAPDAGAVATAPPPAAPSASAATATARSTSAPATSGRVAARAARTPVTVVNYDYLRRDIRMLLILAPAMIVLVIIAFFVFH